MGRPYKIGLDRFSLDAGIFGDEKYLEILRSCGASATTVLLWLLGNIYQQKGYYLKLNHDIRARVADMAGISDYQVAKVINRAVEVGFFSREQFRENKILTSVDIQTRYFKATKRRKGIVWDERYLLIKDILPESARLKGKKVENPVEVKESKPKRPKRKIVPDYSFKGWSGDELLDSVIKVNGDNLLNDDDIFAFVDYWTEQGRDGTYKFAAEHVWNTRLMMQKFIRKTAC